MIQFNNFLYFELAAFFSLFLLILNLFTMKRIGLFKKRDIVRSLLWSSVIFFLGMIIGGAKLERQISVPVKEQMEIIFSLDVSLSSLAQDVEIKQNQNEETKKISRLEFGKQQIENTIKFLSNDATNDAIGLIVFANKAIPLQRVLAREDYQNSLLRNLKFIDDNFVKYEVQQGTDYGNLLMTAMEQFGKNDAKKILFVLTDGEPQGDEEILRQNLIKALELFSKRNNIVVYFLLIGDSSKPSNIPKLKDEESNIREYYTYENGQIVLTRPNPEFLTSLANATQGYFIQAENQNIEKILLASIEKERKIIGWEKKTELIDLTSYLLVCSLIFLFIIPFLKTV